MKKVVSFLSFIFLIAVITVITLFTRYTLKNKGIREEVEEKVSKKVEVVTSNMTKNNLSEIYNIYLNGEKHKLKFDYNLVFIPFEEVVEEVKIMKNKVDISLMAYLDGKTIFSDKVAVGVIAQTSQECFDDEFIANYVRIKERKMKIVNSDNQDYLILDVGYVNVKVKEKYFVVNNDGDIINGEGILKRDDNIYYIDLEDKELDIFYNTKDSEGQILAKIDGNNIFSLNPVNAKNGIEIQEKKYSIVEGKLKEELLTTYVEIKVREEVIPKES